MPKPKRQAPKPPAAWSEPVAHLLTLGCPGGEDGPWSTAPFDDYAAMGITADHTQELRRLMFDTDLHERDLGPRGYGPVHAARALAVLAPPGALADFIELTRRADRLDLDGLLEDTTNLFARIGEPAIEPLARVARDSREPFGARLFFIDALEQLAADHPPARDRIVAILADLLKYATLTDPRINSCVVDALQCLHATEALPAIRDAYAAGGIDEQFAGTLEHVEHRLSITPEQAAEEDRAARAKVEAELEARFPGLTPEQARQALMLEAMEGLPDDR
jgi:hypothetical protein